MFGEEDLIRIHQKRAYTISNILTVCFLVIFIRLWYLQIYKGEVYHTYSIQNRLRKEIIRAPRGMIFSRNDVLLVDNAPRFDAMCTPQFLQKKEETLNSPCRDTRYAS
jgi:penicillin-binding protein 2